MDATTHDDGLDSWWFDVLGVLGSATLHALLGLALFAGVVATGVAAGRVGWWVAGVVTGG